MEKLFMKLLEDAKKNKKGLIMLKNTAVRCQNFELASQLRGIEREKFPETKEEKDSKHRAKELNLIFRMVDLNISDKHCLIIYEALKLFVKKKGKFGIDDASKIVCKINDMYLE